MRPTNAIQSLAATILALALLGGQALAQEDYGFTEFEASG